MTMDFGDGHNALADAESAAQATAQQLATIYGVSTPQAYRMMGLTPIAGKNDDDENFSQSDAATLENFTASNGVRELSFWEVDGYDKATGYAYSNIFNQISTTRCLSRPPEPTRCAGSVGLVARSAVVRKGRAPGECRRTCGKLAPRGFHFLPTHRRRLRALGGV
ncbi:hypothetical protein [Streptomyces puniciscabiei]|nr:hypothetical protein [Streptomyces puniciscabiei]